MKIIAMTSIRSEYDLMSSLYFLLHEDHDIEFKLLVGGAHNSQSFGLSVSDIRKDGFEIIQIESLIDGDSSSSRLKSASILLMSSIDIIKNIAPDLIIYAGDREEVLIGSIIGGYLGIPTMHFFGGDHASDGHIDNAVRHSASKLSTYHMVSIEEHKQRLIAIGEESSRIFNIGSVALDKFSNIEINPEIANEVAGKQIKRKYAIFIFHPIESELATIDTIISDVINSLLNQKFHVFISRPNSDHGNSIINKVYDNFLSNEHVTVYHNLPRVKFVQLFKSSNLIIGNSSAGILEAASIPVPCINIGQRQKGRLAGENVQFIDLDVKAIEKAIIYSQQKEYLDRIAKMTNPYGSGNASTKAYEIIKKLNLHAKLEKKEDPLFNE